MIARPYLLWIRQFVTAQRHVTASQRYIIYTHCFIYIDHCRISCEMIEIYIYTMFFIEKESSLVALNDKDCLLEFYDLTLRSKHRCINK